MLKATHHYSGLYIDTVLPIVCIIEEAEHAPDADHQKIAHAPLAIALHSGLFSVSNRVTAR